jgi:membrane protein DedA with SNARE-associated domain
VLESAVNWLVDTILAMGYPGIVLLMALESSVFPVPSELVMPPAGYLAAQGRMSAPLALAAGTVGSLVGALANYFVAGWLGRALLHRYSRYVLVSEAALERSEQFFRRHGEIGTFIGRLIPVIRHLISIPAGLARMRMDRFVLYTTAGAGLWCSILLGIGWYLGKHSEVLQHEEVKRYSTIAVLVLLPVLAAIVALYVFRHRRSRTGQHGA